MLNIILPIFGQSSKASSSKLGNHPLILHTIKERPIVAWAISHIDILPIEKRYYIISTEEYIRHHHIDRILPLFSCNEMTFIPLKNNTKGMPCSILMAVDLLNEDEPFLVTSADQYIGADLQTHLDYFEKVECDAGCIGFQSVHPKWSYADVNEDDLIERVVEKIPISRNALTSSYYFSTGRIMRAAIESNILRGETVGGKFYLSPCFNELIIADKKVVYSKMDAYDYFNFYSKEVINEFSEYISQDPNRIKQITRRYASLFNAADLGALKDMFLPDISIEDSFTPKISGFELVVDFFASLFNSSEVLNFNPQTIALIDADTTMIKFKLQVNDDHFEGVDILKFRSMKLLSLSAYLHKTN